MRTSALVATTGAFAGLGPPLGLLVFLADGLVFSLVKGDRVGNVLWGFLPLLVLLQVSAFKFGAIPALAAGLVVALVAHRFPDLFLAQTWKRAVLSGLVSAFMGTLWFVVLRPHFVAPHPSSADLLLYCSTAGIPAALLGSFFPTRGWLAAPSNNRRRGREAR